jgi:DNA-binding MarR family transcriptional regulator
VVRPLSRSAIRAAHEVKVVFTRLRRRVQELALAEDLSPSQTSVLTRLNKEGPTTGSLLAVAEGVSPQAIATILGVLDSRGLIRRRVDPHDGRRHVITLSEEGVARAAATSQAREEWLARALQDNLTEEERRIVLHAMGILDRLTHAGHKARQETQ